MAQNAAVHQRCKTFNARFANSGRLVAGAEKGKGGRMAALFEVGDGRVKPGHDESGNYEHPVVDPHVSHFMQVPLRTSVKLPHSPQASPS